MSKKTGRVKIWQIGSVLRNIYKNPGITRINLANKLDVDKSAITRLLSILINDNWLDMADPQTKNIPLVLNPRRIYTAGLDIQPYVQRLVVCDFQGRIITQKKWNREKPDIGEFLNGPVKKYIGNLDFEIASLGVSLPGPYEKATNRLLASNPLEVVEPLELPHGIEGISIPLFYGNDAQCCGWGIVAYQREKRDFLMIHSHFQEDSNSNDSYLKVAIGSSLFINQSAYRGSNSCAAEVRNLFHGDYNHGGQFSIPQSERVRIKTDSSIRQQFFAELAMQIGFVSNYLDLKKIYISGSLEQYPSELERILREYMLKSSLYPNIQKSEIHYVGEGDFSPVKGAAGLALESILTEPQLENPSPFYENIILQSQR